MNADDNPADAGTPEQTREKTKRALRNRARVAAVEAVNVTESAHTMPPLDCAVRIAAHALSAPVAQLNILTAHDLIPIAVHTGEAEDAASWRAPRTSGHSYCKYVVWSREPLVVNDAHAHVLVRHSHITREMNIGAYLGVPLLAPSVDGDRGHVIGSLCVIDHKPRAWTPGDIELLSDLAELARGEIAHRARTRVEVREADRQMARVLDAAGAAVIATDADGVITLVNPAAATLFGYAAEEMVAHDLHSFLHHSYPDGTKFHEADCGNYLARRESRTHVTRNDTFWRADGTPVTADSIMTPVLERGEVIGTVLTLIDVSARSP